MNGCNQYKYNIMTETIEIKVTECADCPFLIKIDYDDFCKQLRQPIFDRYDKYIRNDCPLLKKDIVIKYIAL